MSNRQIELSEIQQCALGDCISYLLTRLAQHKRQAAAESAVSEAAGLAAADTESGSTDWQRDSSPGPAGKQKREIE